MIACWGLAVSGAESEDGAGDRPSSSPSSREGRGGRSRSGFRERMEQVNRQLKEKFPTEYAELEKLRETDRFGAMRKMAELAEKAGIEMPFGRRPMRPRGENPENNEWQEFFAKLKEKFPTEFDAIRKKISTSPQAALAELKALAEKAGLEMPKGDLPQAGPGQPERVAINRNRNRILVAQANRILARTRPEDYAKLQALREVDDDEARAFFRKLVREERLTPERLLGEPIRPARVVSFTDKDIEAQNPATNSNGRGWGGGNRGGGWGGPPRF